MHENDKNRNNDVTESVGISDFFFTQVIENDKNRNNNDVTESVGISDIFFFTQVITQFSYLTKFFIHSKLYSKITGQQGAKHVLFKRSTITRKKNIFPQDICILRRIRGHQRLKNDKKSVLILQTNIYKMQKTKIFFVLVETQTIIFTGSLY